MTVTHPEAREDHGVVFLGYAGIVGQLVQDVLRLMLEAYFEPQFSDHSHGFRPERGCHTALRNAPCVEGTTWFIEEISRNASINSAMNCSLKLSRSTFMTVGLSGFLQELLDAGYLEDWTFNETPSGVPQGGIVSPILSNILLDTLDTYVETVLMPKYTRGARKGRNNEYQKLILQSWRQRRKGNVEKAEELRKQAQGLHSTKDDPHYRRLKYIRYADDFLLGFSGPKSEAEEIKQHLREFLQGMLKLELSEEKTLITHARSEAARFLGYEITTFKEDGKRTKRNTNNRGVITMCRSINGGIGLQVPNDVLKEKCRRYMRKGETIHRVELMEGSDYEIIMTYQLEYRGIAQYYRLAYSMSKLTKLKWVMERSLTKTLAAKHKLSVPESTKNIGQSAW